MKNSMDYGFYINYTIQQEGIQEAEIKEICRIHDLSIAEFLNEFSRTVALDYYLKKRDYEDCDIAMNGIFACLIDFSLSHDMLEPAYSIFLAFDDGEYRRSKDAVSVDPSEKYTRPQIEIILKEYQVI